MSVEYERLEIPMDLELKWTKEKLLKRDKQISGLISKNISLREELQENISLRDHFAGLAMQGLLASDTNTKWDEDDIALIAYGQADAMMEMREKNG
jgi:hypothetical protein